VREAAAEANARHPARPLELTVSEDLPALPLSRTLLHAVLVQLFTNAARAHTGSDVEPGRACPVAVTATNDDGGIWLHVRDHGRGMGEGQVAWLTEPFAAGRQPGAAGIGLGFFLVRQAAAKWGGAVRVQSEPGRGTTVSLFLPLLGG